MNPDITFHTRAPVVEIPLQITAGPSPEQASPAGANSAEEWAIELNLACRSAQSSVIEQGKVFHAAKSRLAYGEWTRIWKLESEHRPPVTIRTGDKYAAIGEQFGEANRKCTSSLPGCVETLYRLALLGRELVMELILDGTIDRLISKSKAQALVDKYRPELERKPRPFSFSRWLDKLHKQIEEIETDGAPEDRELALAEMEKTVAGWRKAEIKDQRSEVSDQNIAA